MSQTVTQAIAKVRRYLDSTSSDARWSDSDIREALQLAMDQIISEAADAGLDMFTATQTSTIAADGYVAVAGFHKIINVFYTSGTAKLKVQAGNARSRKFVNSGLLGGSVEIDYIPSASLPSSDGYTIDYGNDIDNAIIDSYLCLLAASDLKVTDGEGNPELDKQLARVRSDFRGLSNSPNIYVMPMTKQFPRKDVSGYFWYKDSPTSIKLYF